MQSYINFNLYKKFSIALALVIFMSCISIISFEVETKIDKIDVSEKLANSDIAEFSYEALVLHDKFIQNRCKYRNTKVNMNYKIAMQHSLIAINNIYKPNNTTIHKNISNVHFINETILMYIHEKDGKKDLI